MLTFASWRCPAPHNIGGIKPGTMASGKQPVPCRSAFLQGVESRCVWLTLLKRHCPPSELQEHADKALALFKQQAIASQNITPEIATSCLCIVSRVMGEEAAMQLSDCMRPVPIPAEVLEMPQWPVFRLNDWHPCVIVASSTASPQPQILFDTRPRRLHRCDYCQIRPRAPPLAIQDRPYSEAASSSCIGTAGVSAAVPVENLVPPAANVGSAGQTGSPCIESRCIEQLRRMEVLEKFHKAIQELTAPADPPPDTHRSHSIDGTAPSPKHKVKAAAKGRGKGKDGGTSKPNGVIMVQPRPQPSTIFDANGSPALPACPGVGKQPPIRHGKSTVYFSPAGERWRVKPQTGSRLAHGVRWGQTRKDQIENWKKVKEWLRKYN